MPRKSLFAHVGNPVNLDTVPANQTEVTLLTQVASPEEDQQRTRSFLLKAYGYCAVSCVVFFMFAGLTSGSDFSFMILLALLAIFVIRPKLTSPNFAILTLAAIVFPLFVGWFIGHPAMAVLVDLIALGYLGFQFRRHYLSCTMESG